MATLRIREYAMLGLGFGNRSAPFPLEPGTDQEPVDFSGGSAASAAFDNGTRFIAVQADADCFYALGADPEASASGLMLIGGAAPVLMAVRGGDKIAAMPAEEPAPPEPITITVGVGNAIGDGGLANLPEWFNAEADFLLTFEDETTAAMQYDEGNGWVLDAGGFPTASGNATLSQGENSAPAEFSGATPAA